MIERLVKSAEQAWKEDFEEFVIKNQCVSRLEDAVDLNKPDFTDCAVEGWYFKDCGDMVLYMKNEETCYYWKFVCSDWYGFFGNEKIMAHFLNSENVSYSHSKKQDIIHFLCSDREQFVSCEITDTPFNILDFLDISYHVEGYGTETNFIHEFEEVDETLLAKTQYEELVGLIRGMSWREIIELDIKNEYRATDDTDNNVDGRFGYIYYKNCRYQVYEDTKTRDICLDLYNIDVYSDCSYHCDGDCKEDVQLDSVLDDVAIITYNEEKEVENQECVAEKIADNTQEHSVEHLKIDMFHDTMMAIIDNQRLLIIEKIKQRVLEGKNIRDWMNNIDVLADKTGWDWMLDCHKFSELKISRAHMLSGSRFNDYIEPGDVYIYDAETDVHINLKTFCVESLLKIYSAMR